MAAQVGSRPPTSRLRPIAPDGSGPGAVSVLAVADVPESECQLSSFRLKDRPFQTEQRYSRRERVSSSTVSRSAN